MPIVSAPPQATPQAPPQAPPREPLEAFQALDRIATQVDDSVRALLRAALERSRGGLDPDPHATLELAAAQAHAAGIRAASIAAGIRGPYGELPGDAAVRLMA